MKAEEIQKLRELLKITQADLAQRIGVDVQTVQRWEQKRGKPSRLARRQLNNLADTIQQIYGS